MKRPMELSIFIADNMPCEHPGCDSTHTALVMDMIKRVNLKTHAFDLELYGREHFFCAAHIRMSYLFSGHPRQIVCDSVDYFKDQIRHAHEKKNVKSHILHQKKEMGHGGDGYGSSMRKVKGGNSGKRRRSGYQHAQSNG